jgi:hypothetical protein
MSKVMRRSSLPETSNIAVSRPQGLEKVAARSVIGECFYKKTSLKKDKTKFQRAVIKQKKPAKPALIRGMNTQACAGWNTSLFG